MIAPNNEPGRNDPCPCGSGLKYKRCCGVPQIKALRQDNIRMRALAYAFLCQIQKLTGAQVVAVPIADLAHCVPEIKLVRDDARGMILCAAKPPQTQEVIGPRRIVLPGAAP